jgi:cytoskeletal protein CcmA (bactofilin family)
MAIFSRTRKAGDEEDMTALEQDSELDLPVKPASRPSGGGAVPHRPAAMPPMGPAGESRLGPARPGETRIMEGKSVPEMTRPSDMARRLVEAPPPIRPEPELRKLTVGREISLQGEITHCDQLVIEGSVTANLSCQEVSIMESGVLKGAVEIGQVEVRGVFEGTLNATGRLLIRSTGRVVGKIRYGQIEIEIGGQIAGEIEAQAPVKGSGKNAGAAAPAAASA